MAAGCWLCQACVRPCLAACCWLCQACVRPCLAACWLLSAGCWLLAAACCLLPAACWLLPVAGLAQARVKISPVAGLWGTYVEIWTGAIMAYLIHMLIFGLIAGLCDTDVESWPDGCRLVAYCRFASSSPELVHRPQCCPLSAEPASPPMRSEAVAGGSKPPGKPWQAKLSSLSRLIVEI